MSNDAAMLTAVILTILIVGFVVAGLRGSSRFL